MPNGQIGNLCKWLNSLLDTSIPGSLVCTSSNVEEKAKKLSYLQAEAVDMGMKMLMMSVPGIPGEDYPILQQVQLFPREDFFHGEGFFPGEEFS